MRYLGVLGIKLPILILSLVVLANPQQGTAEPTQDTNAMAERALKPYKDAVDNAIAAENNSERQARIHRRFQAAEKSLAEAFDSTKRSDADTIRRAVTPIITRLRKDIAKLLTSEQKEAVQENMRKTTN